MYLPSAHDPHQFLDHRWLRAGWLLQNGLPPAPKHDDRWVGQALHFRSALDGCSDEVGELELADAMPAIFQAYALHRAEPPLLRWAVEARILSGEPFAEIARKCALLPEAVAAYEALFFAVGDKLDAGTWIMCQVIGRKAFVGLTENDVDTWWKLLGYTLGPWVLDIVIQGMIGLPRPKTAAELDETLASAARTLFSLKKLHATYLLPVTPAYALQILQVAVQMDICRPRGQSNAEDPVAAFWTNVLDQRLAAPPSTVADDSGRHLISLPPPTHRDAEVLPAVREAI